jgi:hypothetical protein
MGLWVTVRFGTEGDIGLWSLSLRGVPVVIVCRVADRHRRGCIITSAYLVRCATGVIIPPVAPSSHQWNQLGRGLT